MPTASAQPLKKLEFGTSRWQLSNQATPLALVRGRGGRDEARVYSFCPLTQAVRIFHPGSSLDANYRLPEWKTFPPPSAATRCIDTRSFDAAVSWNRHRRSK